MSRYQPLVQVADLPLNLGPMTSPHNFAGLPDVLPFELGIDLDLGAVRQRYRQEVEEVLQRAYQEGNLFGTPLADDEFGAAYAHDFIDFIDRNAVQGRRQLKILEIGAGTGFLSHKLEQAGHVVTAIEPGASYKPYWDHYGIKVLNTFFPTPAAPGPYDVIISYGVLEHIDDSVAFVRRMVEHLAPGGIIVAAVPDCTEEILHGDPGMLAHEHYWYFTSPSFRRLLQAADLDVISLQPAQHSRLLFSASKPGSRRADAIGGEELAVFQRYEEKFIGFRYSVARALEENVNGNRSLGIYCPGRSLAVLPVDIDARFFDDASYYKDKFFPPFPISIEDQEDFFRDPVEEVWIMSRSFGDLIAKKLAPSTERAIVRKIEDF